MKSLRESNYRFEGMKEQIKDIGSFKSKEEKQSYLIKLNSERSINDQLIAISLLKFFYPEINSFEDTDTRNKITTLLDKLGFGTKEHEIFFHILGGYNDKQIAEQMALTYSVVRTRHQKLITKLLHEALKK